MATNRLIAGLIGIFIILGVFYITFQAGSTGEVVADLKQPNTKLVSEVGTEYSVRELGEKFLTTKSTGEKDLGCGPPDDFDCGLNRYSGYMALANIEAYQNTKEEKYLDYAINFALAEQTNPPEWCLSCTCNPPEDFDCGMGEVQAEMMEVFAKLYLLTGQGKYLEYAERFAHTMPSDPPEGCQDCICGPPDDFDCGATYVQTAYLANYRLLYKITNNSVYLEYIHRLGDAWLETTVEEVGPRIIGFLLEVSQVTGDTLYFDRAILLGSEMVGDSCEITIPGIEHADHDESAYLDTVASLYQHTEDEKFLECAKKLIVESKDCPERVCQNMVEQASMIRQNIRLFQLSGLQEYLRFAEEFGELDNINAVQTNWYGYVQQCEDFDCQDAEDQALIAHALLELAEAKGEKTLSTGELGETFLLTKSTGERDLGCGPPDDFDCGLNRYSGYMALANIEAYQNTGDENYLEYAIKFATTPQTNPPEWCLSCICNPPDDFDCGMGEIQVEMMDVFAKLYQITGEDNYLEYAEKFAHTIPTDPPKENCYECICGPPDDFHCGQTYVQSGYVGAYGLLYELTNDLKYINYVRKLGDAWMDETIDSKGPSIIGLFHQVYIFTEDEKYLDHITALGSELIGDSCEIELMRSRQPSVDFNEAAFLDSLAKLYRVTEDNYYVECASKIVTESEQCPEGICGNIMHQTNMIRANIELFEITGEQEFLQFAEEFGELDNINAVQTNWFGYVQQCEDFDCQDAEDQALIAHALLELAKAKGEITG